MSKKIKAKAGGSEDVRAWVATVKDPRQRALAAAIPEICGVFGLSPADLGVRTPSKSDHLLVVIGGGRKYAIGMAAYIGRVIGLYWNDMHGRKQGDAQAGHTEIRDLAPLHRHSLNQFCDQFAVLAGLPVDGHPPGEPVGEIGRFIRDRYVQIHRDIAAAAGRGETKAA